MAKKDNQQKKKISDMTEAEINMLLVEEFKAKKIVEETEEIRQAFEKEWNLLEKELNQRHDAERILFYKDKAAALSALQL